MVWINMDVYESAGSTNDAGAIVASDETWVGIPEVAACLHVSTDTAYRWVDTQGFPRLLSAEAVRKAIARGVETGLFGHATGRSQLGDDGRFLIDRSRIAFERSVADDEVDLDAGLLIAPSAIPEKPSASGSETTDFNVNGEGTGQSGDGDDSGAHPSSGEGSGVVYPTDDREIAVSFVSVGPEERLRRMERTGQSRGCGGHYLDPRDGKGSAGVRRGQAGERRVRAAARTRTHRR